MGGLGEYDRNLEVGIEVAKWLPLMQRNVKYGGEMGEDACGKL